MSKITTITRPNGGVYPNTDPAIVRLDGGIRLLDAEALQLEDYGPQTYSVYRFFGPELGTPRKLMAEGLTLEEAQENCEDPDSQGDGFMDGYEKE